MRALHISIVAGGLYLWSEGTGPDSLKELKQQLLLSSVTITIVTESAKNLWLKYLLHNQI
jgi:hypothetical protein